MRHSSQLTLSPLIVDENPSRHALEATRTAPKQQLRNPGTHRVGVQSDEASVARVSGFARGRKAT